MSGENEQAVRNPYLEREDRVSARPLNFTSFSQGSYIIPVQMANETILILPWRQILGRFNVAYLINGLLNL